MKLFELFATLGLDTSQFDTSLNQAIGVSKGLRDMLEQLQQETQRTGQQGGQAASYFKSQWADVKDTLQGVFTFSAGQLVAQGISSGMNMLKQFTAESIDLASDLNEVQNVIDVTFGKDVKKIESWSKQAKNAIGMSELSAKRYVGTMGAMLKSSGLTGEAVSDLSMQVVNMAGDIASFYNLDHDTAFQKIRSGISGETEPLKQLGINMSVANLEAFRLKQGITTAYEKMSQSQQVELRIKYLAQATADAAGDFERTADSYANARKTLEANFDTLMADVGSFFLPAAEFGINFLNSLFEGERSFSARLAAIDTELKNNKLEISFNSSSADALITSLEEMESQTERTEAEQALWMSTLQKLTQIVPDLSTIINLQTGEIDGGTKALRENTQAWKENQIARSVKTAYEEKQSILDEAIQGWASNEASKVSSQAIMDDLRLELEELYKATVPSGALDGFDAQIREIAGDERIARQFFNRARRMGVDLTQDQFDEYIQKAARYVEAKEELNKAISGSDESWKGIETAESNLAAFEDAYKSAVSTLEAGNDVIDATGLAYDQFAAKFETLEDIAQRASDYRQQIIDATRSQVNSLLSDFKQIEKIDGMWGTDEKGKPKRFDLNEDMEALRSQLDFQRQYQDYLQSLKAEGNLSDDLIAYFASNISEENAERMRALTGMSSLYQQEYSDLFDARNAGNTGLTDTASQMQIDLSDTYQLMQSDVEQLWAEISAMADDAHTSMIDLMTGADNGLKEVIPDIEDRFAELRAMIASMVDFSDIYAAPPSFHALTEWSHAAQFNAQQGMSNLVVGSSGTGSATAGPINASFGDAASSILNAHGHAVGLDYVPYDGYMAKLHEGERIMTRLENQQFSRGEIGGQGADTTALGPMLATALREAMQSVGVYMDGVAVGHLVSETVSGDIADSAWAERY